MDKSLVLYSTGCTACKNLKLMLQDAGIEYTENNSIDEMLALGISQVPVLSVDGELMTYDDAKKWVQSNNNNKGGADEKQ